MKFGLRYSLRMGVHPTGDDYIRVAQHAEALGYRTIWVGDYIVIPEHIAAPYPYTLRQQRRFLTGYEAQDRVAQCRSSDPARPRRRAKQSAGHDY